MITESWGAGANDLFMDPSGPLWPLGIHQTDANREGGRMGEEGGGGEESGDRGDESLGRRWWWWWNPDGRMETF